MKRLILSLIAVTGVFPAWSSGAGAQATAPQVVQFSPPSWRDYRVAALMLSTKRLIGTSPTGTSFSSQSFPSFEVVFVGTDAGVRFSYAAGEGSGGGPAANRLVDLDGRVNFGTRAFRVEVGYLMRTETFGTEDSVRYLARAGFRSDFQLGSSGVMTGFAASYLHRLEPEQKDEWKVSGIEAETSVLYVPPRVPVFVQVGFRRQVLRAKTPADLMRPEESSVVFFGVGLQAGLR